MYGRFWVIAEAIPGIRRRSVVAIWIKGVGKLRVSASVAGLMYV